MKHSGPIIAQRDSLKVISCATCGFYHLHPIPNVDIYQSGKFYSEVKPDYAQEYHADHSWWSAIYGDWLSLIDDIVPNRILVDIGAGTGDFVNSARHRNFIAYGVEPDERMARSHGLTHGSYWGFKEANNIGVISAHWVMEHLADPVDFLQWAYGQLAQNGILLVTIPNDFSHLQYKAMERIGKPYYWLHETHINYWHADLFKDLLRDNKFYIANGRCYGSWEPERYLIAGQNYLDDQELGRKLHKQRMADELAMDTKERRARMKRAGLMDWGRDMTYVAVKR